MAFLANWPVVMFEMITGSWVRLICPIFPKKTFSKTNKKKYIYVPCKAVLPVHFTVSYIVLLLTFHGNGFFTYPTPRCSPSPPTIMYISWYVHACTYNWKFKFFHGTIIIYFNEILCYCRTIRPIKCQMDLFQNTDFKSRKTLVECIVHLIWLRLDTSSCLLSCIEQWNNMVT